MQQGLASLSFVGPFRQSQFLSLKVQLSHNKKIHDTIKYMKRILLEERAQNMSQRQLNVEQEITWKNKHTNIHNFYSVKYYKHFIKQYYLSFCH